MPLCAVDRENVNIELSLKGVPTPAKVDYDSLALRHRGFEVLIIRHSVCEFSSRETSKN